MAAVARPAVAAGRWLSEGAGHWQLEQEQQQRASPPETEGEEAAAINAESSRQDAQGDFSESLRASLEAAKLSALIPILVKLGVEEADDLTHVHGADLGEFGAKVVQQRKFEEWKQQRLQDAAALRKPALVRRRSGVEMEEYCGRVMERVLGAKVGKPAPMPRQQLDCNVQAHNHGKVDSETSQPDFLVGSPGQTLVVEVKDYTGRVKRESLDKLLSDKLSHKAEHALLVLGPSSRLGDGCRQRLRDHKVHVVEFRSNEGAPNEDDLASFTKALEDMGLRSLLGGAPTDVGAADMEQEVQLTEVVTCMAQLHLTETPQDMGLRSLLGGASTDVGAVDMEQAQVQLAEVVTGMAQLQLTDTPQEPARAPSSCSAAAQGSGSVPPGAHHEARAGGMVRQGPVEEERPTRGQRPLAAEETPGSGSEDDDDDEGDPEPGDAGETLAFKARPRSGRLAFLSVPRVEVRDDGSVKFESEEFHLRREAHDLFDAAGTGWEWLLAKIGSEPGCVAAAQEGLEYNGRRYYVVSVSKGSHKQPATAWCASPPNDAGPQAVEQVLAWGQRFQLKAPTSKRPFPLFTLRSRVKQLFSCSWPLPIPSDVLEVARLPEDIGDPSGLVRTDGWGEIDPALLEEGFRSLFGEEPDEGTRRRLPWSAQIRDGGVKGMVSASNRLRGTGRLEVRPSMWKFEGLGPQLRVVTFSVVRRTALNLSFLLRLQALGVDQDVFKNAQRKVLDKLTGPRTRKEAARLLQVDLESAGSSWTQLTDGGANYFGSFAAVLLAGFDVDQQPLRTILEKNRDRELQSAGKRLSLEGCWSCRGVPEPADAEGRRILEGNQVFCTVPDSEGGWRALTGRVLVGQPQDLDPSALRLAEAIDTPELRKTCGNGVLHFSVRGQALQADLGWDFDGDYYVVIENPDLVPDGLGIYAPRPKARAAAAQPLPPTPPGATPPLAEVNGHFLKEFPQYDKMGLLHCKWHCIAGQGDGAAARSEARELAALYGEAVDVEKGGTRPEVPKIYLKKWDFMREGDPSNRSRTVAGEVYRMAADALARRRKAEPGAVPAADLKPDIHLEDAWARAKARLPEGAVAWLTRRAGELHLALKKRVVEKVRASEADHAQDNPSSMALDEEQRRALREWMDKTRDEERRAVEDRQATLEDLALACWHSKYVLGKVALSGAADPDQFPWTLFGAELCSVKERGKICTQAEGERRRHMLLDIKRLAASAAEEHGADQKKTMKRLRAALTRLSAATWHCQSCAAAAASAHAALLGQAAAASGGGNAEASLSVAVMDDIRRIRTGAVEMLPVSELRYTKATIQAHFQYGEQAGQHTEELVQRLLGESRGETLAGLELKAVRYHGGEERDRAGAGSQAAGGQVYVVEGNRRLWALQEAERRSGEKLSVRVVIQDLYVGLFYGKPALRMFWERYDSRNNSTRVDVVEDVADPPQPPLPTQPDAGSAAQAPVVAPAQGPAAAAAAAAGRSGGGGPTPTPSGDTRVDFGRHRGKRYEEMRETEPSYCEYVLRESERGGCAGLMRLAGYLRSCST